MKPDRSQTRPEFSIGGASANSMLPRLVEEYSFGFQILDSGIERELTS